MAVITPPDRRATMPPQANSPAMRLTIGLFVAVPTIAMLAAVPLAWNGWLSWVDITLVVLLWTVTGLGITVGYHRLFTHGSFKANRPVRIALAIAGSMALEGSVAQWVADHRKHHRFSDDVGDPHSPWRFGTSKSSIAKGLAWAHLGWLFAAEQTPIAQYAPDVAADRDLQRITRAFPLIVAFSLLLPAALGGLLTWSWHGALTGLLWGGLVRIALVHHVTWSINSICHVWGATPFESHDLSGNVAWLAIPAFGENWHNLHHADPTSARHGVMRGQVDLSALVIRGLERAGWATDVRWPRPERLVRKLRDPRDVVHVRGHDATRG